MDTTGKVVFVTGGSSGMGAAVMRHFAAKGNKVVTFNRSKESGERMVAELGEENCMFCQGDVASEADVQNAIQATIDRFGRLDILVCNAGYNGVSKVVGRKGPYPLELFKNVIESDFIGVFNTIRLGCWAMKDNEPNADGERGVVICTSSIAADEGQVGQAAYSGSKGGINGLILPCARELASLGIRINAISPGLFLTPAVEALPQQVQEKLAADIPFPARLGRPAEFAMLVDAIVSNPYINGTNIRIDAALRMR